MLTQTTSLPIGQRLLQAGFQRTTRVELEKLLKVADIWTLENEFVKSDLLNRAKQKHPTRRVTVEDGGGNEWAVRVYRSSFFGETWEWDDQFQRSMKRVVLDFIPLDHYVDQVIPADVLAKLTQARELGLTIFHVVAPKVQDMRPAGDPALVGTLGDELVLIGVWG